MYPRVKVKQQGDPIAIQEETSFIVRLIEPLSLEGHFSSRIMVSDQGTERGNDSHQSHARISKTDRKKLVQQVVASKGKDSKGFDEDGKTNIRASSVPRPRAVLSSPDNDEMIGNQNQRIRRRATPIRRQTLVSDVKSGQHKGLTGEKRLLPRKQNLSSNTQAEGKPNYSTLSARRVRRGGGNNSVAKEKHSHSSESSIPRQKPPFK